MRPAPVKRALMETKTRYILRDDVNTRWYQNMRPTHSLAEIRPALESDVPIVLRFIQKLAEYERLSDEVIADEKTLKRWLFGPKPAAEVVLAWIGDRPLGFAVFFTTFSTFAGRPGLYLEDLFVDLEYRGTGVGKALLMHVARLAIKRGYCRLTWSVLNWNQPAIDFYKNLGAVASDQWATYHLTGEALRALVPL